MNYLKLLEQERDLLKSRKLLLYDPHAKQLAFHKSLASTRAIFGGNRSGKTTAGGMDFLFHMTGQYPDWYPKQRRFSGPVKGRIVAKDLQKGVGEVIIPFLDEWLDKSLITKTAKNPGSNINCKFILKNGSQFDILTHNMDTEQFEGWRGHVAWFDEPPPRDKYIATMRGLVDFGGFNFLTLTPLTQPWIYDQLFCKADGKEIFVVVTDMRDNPHLSEIDIKRFESSLTEEEKEARLHGRFLHLTGLVYKDFQPDFHISEPPRIKKEWTRYFAIDPHERTPTACLWLAVDPKGNHWVYDELWLAGMDIEQIAKAILSQEGNMTPHVRLIDPHADVDNNLQGGFNIRKELMKHGVYCQRGNSDPFLGRTRIRQALKVKFSPVSKRDVSIFKISPNCTQTIFEFQHYIYDEHKRNKEEHELKENVKKKNDHFMDALRYIYNFGPRYIEQDQEEDTLTYKGEYAKYPSITKQAVSGYHELVERD